MSNEIVEIEFYEGVDNVSEKLKNSTFIAYINLHGSFQGVTRVSGDTISHSLKEILNKSSNRCLFNRISLKRNSEWDELLLMICNALVIACYGDIGGKEIIGGKALEEAIRRINENAYSKGIIETIETPTKLVEEQLGVKIEAITEKPVEEIKPEAPQKTSLKTEEKPPEIEEVIEEGLETAATIPVETSVSKTEMLPEQKEIPPEHMGLPIPQPRIEEKREEKTISKKPMVIEEISRLDKPLMDLSERLLDLASSENINILNAVVKGDPDILEIEMTVAKLGFGRKREKMLRLTNSLADLFTDILIKNHAPQKELIVVVRHGYDAVKIVRKIKS